MGKLVQMMIILVVIDILFLVTGQLGQGSPSAFMINMILDPANITASQFWNVLISGGGITTLLATTGVIIGALLSATNIIIFLPMGIILANLIGDYVTLFLNLNSHNPVFATIVMVPLMVAYVITVVEWIRAKD